MTSREHEWEVETGIDNVSMCRNCHVVWSLQSASLSCGLNLAPTVRPPPSPTGRPSFESICMRLAFLVAERSTCRRLKVGCVIATPDFRKMLAWGYNGNVSGGPNDCDRYGPEAVGACGCLHAEANAIINCDAPRATSKKVFITDLPCVNCAKMLVQLGNVSQVFYRRDYRIRDSLEWLSRAGISVTQLPEDV